MAGHNKWSKIKHKKKASDAKRGKLFTKLIKAVTVAAREGGGDPDMNPTLRTAVSACQAANMPSDNIDRAIKKGTGELEGVVYEEVYYEGYGAGGTAVYVYCLTDNKNRTAAEVRSAFNKNNGNMAGAGSVGWIFEAKGVINVDLDKADEDELMEAVLEAGAEDFSSSEDGFEITCAPQDFDTVKKALEAKSIEPASAELTQIPKNTVKLDADDARRLFRLIDVLEDNDDVQNVYANFDIPDEIMNELE